MPASPSPTDIRRPLVAAFVVLAAVAVVYVPSALTNGFVYDDYRFIVENPHVLRPGNLTESPVLMPPPGRKTPSTDRTTAKC